MTEKPLVSVIINCYNGEKYLREAIDSVIAQTYENWELVFWDNQSTDSTREIVESYKNPKIKYFYAPEHTSLGEARNLAMEKANGRYISYLDSDDIWYPDWICLFVDTFEEQPNVGVVYCNFITCERGEEKLIPGSSIDKIVKLDELIENYNIGMSGAAIRASTYREQRIAINNKFSLIEDFDFFLRLAGYCEVMYYSKPHMKYRVHTSNLSNKPYWAEEMTEFRELVLSNNDTYGHLVAYLPLLDMKVAAYKFVDALIKRQYLRAFMMKPRAFLGMLRRGFKKF